MTWIGQPSEKRLLLKNENQTLMKTKKPMKIPANGGKSTKKKQTVCLMISRFHFPLLFHHLFVVAVAVVIQVLGERSLAP
jgi:hypothetical protein